MWKTVLRISMGAAAAVAVACSTSVEPEPEGSEESSSERRGSQLEEVDPDPSSSAGTPFGDDPSETTLPGERVQEIDWEEAETFPTAEDGIVPPNLREAYRGAPVPVLLPSDREALGAVEPTMSRHWYAAMFEVDGREVTIEGDRVARTARGLRPEGDEERVEGGFSLSRAEGVLVLSFTAFGAAYTMEVECRDVDKRGTCTNPSFAVDLANRLVRIGVQQ